MLSESNFLLYFRALKRVVDLSILFTCACFLEIFSPDFKMRVFSCIPDRYVLHFFCLNGHTFWWLDSIENLEPGEGRNIPTEKGSVILEYVGFTFVFVWSIIVYVVAGGWLTYVSKGSSVNMFWWLYGVTVYPMLFIGLLLRLWILRVWEVQVRGGSPTVVYVYRPTDDEDQAESREWCCS